MEIKKLEEAKKYLGKKVFGVFRDEKIQTYYIGGINLYYNNVSYEVEGFHLFKNKNYSESYGDVNLKDFQTSFNKDFDWLVYTFSEDVAKQYLVLISKTEKERNKDRDIKTAKELLDEHKVNYEIFK